MEPGTIPDTKGWTVVYPPYINSRLTVAEGRRVAKSQAVDNPQPQEISMILTFLKIMHVFEPMKAFPRDVLCRGRIKAQLKLPSGELANPEVPTSTFYSEKVLLRKLGELIPRLKTRLEGPKDAPDTIQETGGKKKKNKKK